MLTAVAVTGARECGARTRRVGCAVAAAPRRPRASRGRAREGSSRPPSPPTPLLEGRNARSPPLPWPTLPLAHVKIPTVKSIAWRARVCPRLRRVNSRRWWRPFPTRGSRDCIKEAARPRPSLAEGPGWTWYGFAGCTMELALPVPRRFFAPGTVPLWTERCRGSFLAGGYLVRPNPRSSPVFG